MAFGIERWIALATLGMLVFAVWGLPPEPPIRPRSSGKTPEREAASALGARLNRANGLLQRVRWLDSLDLAFDETPEVASGVAVGGPDEAPAAPAVRAAVGREVEELGLEGAGRARVGVFMVDEDQGSHPELRGIRVYGTWEYYAFQGEAGPACLVVVPTLRPREASSRRLFGVTADLLDQVEILGPCAFHHAHGLPGQGIQEWLLHAGFRFARNPAPSSGSPPLRAELPGLKRLNGLFGMQLDRFGVSLGGRSCLGGSTDDCAQVVQGGGEVGEGYPTWFQEQGLPFLGVGRGRFYGGPFGGLESSLLADVEAEFGQTRFRRFWTSGEPLEEAFQASFGQPLGEWVMAWARARLGTEDRGPGLKAGTLLLSLLVVGLAVVGGALAAQRRKVG